MSSTPRFLLGALLLFPLALLAQKKNRGNQPLEMAPLPAVTATPDADEVAVVPARLADLPERERTMFIAEVVESVELLGPDGARTTVDREAMGFGYDISRLHGGDEIALAVTFALDRGDQFTMHRVMQENLSWRGSRHPWGRCSPARPAVPPSGCGSARSCTTPVTRTSRPAPRRCSRRPTGRSTWPSWWGCRPRPHGYACSDCSTPAWCRWSARAACSTVCQGVGDCRSK